MAVLGKESIDRVACESYSGMLESRVQLVQVHPLPFVFTSFCLQCGMQAMSVTGAGSV